MTKLGRKKSNRQALIRNLATSIILYEKVVTTLAKAKTVKPTIDILINRAKKQDLASRRYLIRNLADEKAVKKIFEVLVPRYKERSSGYLKVIRTGNRLGDSSKMVLIQLIDEEKPKKILENKNEKPSSKKTSN